MNLGEQHFVGSKNELNLDQVLALDHYSWYLLENHVPKYTCLKRWMMVVVPVSRG